MLCKNPYSLPVWLLIWLFCDTLKPYQKSDYQMNYHHPLWLDEKVKRRCNTAFIPPLTSVHDKDERETQPLLRLIVVRLQLQC